MTLSLRRKRLNTLFGLLILGAMAYVMWPFVVGPKQMQRFCATLTAGQSYEQVTAAVSAQGYRISAVEKGGAFIYDTASMARFNCNLRFGAQGLQAADYWLND